MRLINVDSYELKHFLDPRRIPQYAILSHTWGEEEVSLQDMELLAQARSRKGFKKIEYCCQQAKKDGYAWAWVDTCCIDKTSSAELSEAINSMFAWYSDSSTCYAYLEDVNSIEELINISKVPRDSNDWRPPRWFTRGWTLQELIAPPHIEFYSVGWGLLGSLSEHQTVIADLTGIDHGILDGSLNLDDVSVATKMSWASKRNTTRKEDEAYCLLGIFDINMPLLYGEGRKAFQRLLHEIILNTEDQTIFLWGYQRLAEPNRGFPMSYKRPCLARTPRDYEGNVHFRPILSDVNPDMKIATQERGIRITARAVNIRDCEGLGKIASYLDWANERDLWAISLNCVVNSSEPNGPPASQGIVAVIIRPSSITGHGVATWSVWAPWYVVIPEKEMDLWSTSTYYLQNSGGNIHDLAPGPVIWKTPTMDYADRLISHQVLTNADNIFPRCSQVDFARGTILDQSSSLPWILITYGTDDDELGGFCDIWRVPELIKSKMIELENGQRLNSRDRVYVLCDARIGELYAAGGSPTWNKRPRGRGTWTKANCCIEEGFMFTAVVSADLELQVSIRRSPSLISSIVVSDRSLEIWHYIESTALPVLYSEHEEYGEFCED